MHPHTIPTQTKSGTRSEALVEALNVVGVGRMARELGINRTSLVRWTDIPDNRRDDVAAAVEKVQAEKAAQPGVN